MIVDFQNWLLKWMTFSFFFKRRRRDLFTLAEIKKNRQLDKAQVEPMSLFCLTIIVNFIISTLNMAQYLCTMYIIVCPYLWIIQVLSKGFSTRMNIIWIMGYRWPITWSGWNFWPTWIMLYLLFLSRDQQYWKNAVQF